MTYREKIQELTEKLNSVYEDAEWLRDVATEPEKKHWNELRKILYDADKPLRRLDNHLSNERANLEI
jgi:hypothetical protein